MAAEAEHVRPAPQADIARFGAEGPAGGDEPFGMGTVGAGVQVDRVGGDAGGGVAGDLSALGGVLSQVAGHGQVIGLFRASASPRHLLELTRLQLERLLLPGPVSEVRLAVLLSAPLTLWQPELFESHSRREICQQKALLIDRLSSRLGRAAVVQALPVPDAQPEFAVRYEPLTGIAPRQKRMVGGESCRRPPIRKRRIGEGICRSQPKDKTSLLRQRPVRLEREPLALEVLSVVPHGPPIQFYLQGAWQRVAHAWGPERIQTGWWRGRDVQRDYYRVETTTGARFWLFRRLSDGAWFLHGMFD